MTLPLNIDDVLLGRSVEWERLKFKQNWNPEDVLHTLCAFANDFHNLAGGQVNTSFLGVAEDAGRPVLPPSGLDPASLDRLKKRCFRSDIRSCPPIIR